MTGVAATSGSVSGAPVIAADVARDAGDRQAIGAVGRDLQRDQRVVERERVAQRAFPARSDGIERQETARIVARAQFLAPSTACRAIPRRASSRA